MLSKVYSARIKQARSFPLKVNKRQFSACTKKERKIDFTDFKEGMKRTDNTKYCNSQY